MKKSTGIHDPNPRVYLTLNDKSVLSATQMRTINPKWYESHYFFIGNPETETLSVRVKDEKSSDVLADCEVKVISLLSESELTIDRGFELNCLRSNAGCSPKIYMKLALKVS